MNHLAKRHPDIPYNSIPELNMPIVKVVFIMLHITSNYICFNYYRLRKTTTASTATRFTNPALKEKLILLRIIQVKL